MERTRAEEIRRGAAEMACGSIRPSHRAASVTWAELQELAAAMLAQLDASEQRADPPSPGCLRCQLETAPSAGVNTWIGGVAHACGKDAG